MSPEGDIIKEFQHSKKSVRCHTTQTLSLKTMIRPNRERPKRLLSAGQPLSSAIFAEKSRLALVTAYYIGYSA